MSAYTLIDKTLTAAFNALTAKLKALAYKDKVAVSDIDASGTPSASTVLAGSGAWVAMASSAPVVDTVALTATWTDAQGNSIIGNLSLNS